MPKLLVVVGATGSQGSAVIKYFQQYEPSYKLRGLTRNKASPSAQDLATSGVEMVQADLNDLDSLKKSFKDASVIFAYTDFGGITRSPEVMGKFMACQLSPLIGAATAEIERRHGMNVADAAATVSGLERLIWSSLSSAKKWSKGKYTYVFSFDVKAEVAEYMLQLKELEGKVSTVQMGMFASNAAKSPQDFGIIKQEDGSIACFIPLDPDLPLPWVDVERDTGVFVNALIRAPAPTHVMGISEYLSYNEWLSLWSSHTGVKAVYHHVLAKTFMTDDPTGFKRTYAEAMGFCEEYGYTGGDPSVITPDELEKEVGFLPRTKIVDHIRRTDWSALL